MIWFTYVFAVIHALAAVISLLYLIDGKYPRERKPQTPADDAIALVVCTAFAAWAIVLLINHYR